LKREIADIEGVLNGSPDHGTRAVLFRIPIDFSAEIDERRGYSNRRLISSSGMPDTVVHQVWPA
jgi:hypothetical protein